MLRLSFSNAIRPLFLLLALRLMACQTQQTKRETTQTQPAVPASDSGARNAAQTEKIAAPDTAKQVPANLPDSAFIELLRLDSSFVLDMRYATENNFLRAKVYDCDQCLLRFEVAKALAKAQQLFKTQGYRIKLFDCYRPLDVQKRMWKIMPDDRYVGNPYGNGSVHNRGAAVDVTLVDSLGNELDMGTGFDHFGKEAHHAYNNLPDTVLANRKLLKEAMAQAGFQPITSEWWHYSYQRNGYPVANFTFNCVDRDSSVSNE